MSELNDELRAALHQRNFKTFEQLINESRNEIHKMNSIFETCLQNANSKEFIELCLICGCRKDYCNTELDKAAINFAADSMCSGNISLLLDDDVIGIQVNHQYAKLTPLNAIAKKLTSDNIRSASAAIDRLLDYGASPNIPDNLGITPLHNIMMKHDIDEDLKRQLVVRFLQMEYLDIDSLRNGQLRELIIKDYPELKLPNRRLQMETMKPYDKLLNELKCGDDYTFTTLLSDFSGNQNEFLNLLEECIKSGRNGAFQNILDTQVNLDINKGFASEKNLTLVELAAIWGNFDILEKLLNNEKLIMPLGKRLLIYVIGRLDEPLITEYCNYVKCFTRLVNSRYIDVNEMDDIGDTALHYAARYNNKFAIDYLLANGAQLGATNMFDEIPLADMEDAKQLEEHFDRCIMLRGKGRADRDFEIILDFKNLYQNFSAVEYMARSKSFRSLLQHPLISSFILLKWNEICGIFYIHLLLHVIFSVSFAISAYLRFPVKNNDMKSLHTLILNINLLFLIYLILAEMLKIYLRKWSYISLKSAFNLIMIGTCCVSITIEFKNPDTSRLLIGYAIVLLMIRLSFLLGVLPYQKSISTHMLMLQETSANFFKSLMTFSIFIIGFGFSFYILFAEPITDEKESYHTFSYLFNSIIKTIIIATGEFEASNIQYKSSYCYLFFCFFVMTTIIVVNLLTGIAVGDSQTIRSEAEINSSICRVKLLHKYDIFKHNNFVTKISIYPNQNNMVHIHYSEKEKRDTMDILLHSKYSQGHKQPKRDSNYENCILKFINEKNRKLFHFKINKKKVQRAIAIQQVESC